MNLGVFLTRGYSLLSWQKNGTLKRELDFYKELEKYNIKITFFSYGTNNSDFKLIKNTNFSLAARPKMIPNFFYSIIMFIIHKKILKNMDIIKTNQIQGTFEAALCSFIYKKKLYSRSGYIPSSKETFVNLSIFSKLILSFEELISCKFSKTISVTSNYAISHLSKRYKIKKDKFMLMYNFVDQIFFDTFSSANKFNNKCINICFVGRLVKLKQPLLLLDILRDFKNIHLYILGDGPLFDDLKKKSSKVGFNVTLVKRIDNQDVAKFFSDKDFFLLPTLEEGNSKVLLEAMASGLIVLTNNLECNKELIDNKKNGFLVENNSPNTYQKYLNKIINNNEQYNIIKSNAHNFAKVNFNRERILNIELKQIEKCTKR